MFAPRGNEASQGLLFDAFQLQSMALDALDRRILAALQEDSRRSYRQLAALCESTVPTISARIRRMEDLGVILGYTVKLDAARFGNPAGPVDISSPVAIACHECGKTTNEPLEATLGDRKHAFCCPTCKRLFTERYNRMRQG